MNEPESGQRFDLNASLEEMIENPKGEFALASDLDEALDLLARWRKEYAKNSHESRDTLALLRKHGRHP